MSLLGGRRSRAAAQAEERQDPAETGGQEARRRATPQAADTGPGRRPPNVSAEAWASVPEDMREEALRLAADGLRRCIHPDETVRRLLEQRGLTVAPAPPQARPQTLAVRGGMRPGRPPAAPQGRDEPAPRTSLGIAVHGALGLAGRPGRDAAEAEESILSAVRADPVLALSDPGALGRLGVRLTRQALEAVADLIQSEAERVIDDIRARKAAGDPSVADWIDPDAWTFGVADMEGDCAPSM